MSKEITRELIILLLVILAIILVLFVLLYEYVPTNKILPEEISYVTSKDVKDKLQSAKGVDEDEVILTYEINQSDLYNYQRINEYKPGKTNPFSTYQKEEPKEEDTNTTGGGSSSGGSGSSSGSSSGQESGTTNNTSSNTTTPGTVNPGNYTNNKGLK